VTAGVVRSLQAEPSRRPLFGGYSSAPVGPWLLLSGRSSAFRAAPLSRGGSVARRADVLVAAERVLAVRRLRRLLCDADDRRRTAQIRYFLPISGSTLARWRVGCRGVMVDSAMAGGCDGSVAGSVGGA